MVEIGDIRSLTDFKRNTAAFLEDLKASGRPHVLTVNGRARVVVQDADAYQRLMELVDRAEALEGIRRGFEDIDQGRTRPAKEALDELRRRRGIPRV